MSIRRRDVATIATATATATATAITVTITITNSVRQCQRRFAARETLNRHQRTHTGEKPHVCQHCGKSFIQAAQLKAHIFYHTGENGFYCDTCGKSFNRKARLNLHIKFVHEGAEPFRCNICDKSFTRKEDLTKHTLVHTGVKRQFIFSLLFARHRPSPTIKLPLFGLVSAHKCDKCEKAFATKSSLQAHSNTHRREPPQSCTECGRAFIRHDCLMRHIRAKHQRAFLDVVAEAEKRQLQSQLLDIASTAAKKIQTGQSTPSLFSSAQLLESIADLLTILIEEETLQVRFAPPWSSHQLNFDFRFNFRSLDGPTLPFRTYSTLSFDDADSGQSPSTIPICRSNSDCDKTLNYSLPSLSTTTRLNHS